MLRSSPTSLCFGLLLAVALSPTAPAQSWEVQDEVEFARSLARFRLFDIASEHLENLGQGTTDTADRLTLLYGRAAIEKIAGEFALLPEDRVFFYELAVKNLEDFANRAGEDHEDYHRAQEDLADTLRQMGTMLSARVQKGENVKANKEAAEQSFRKAVETLNKIFNTKKAHLDNVRAVDDPDMEDSVIQDLIIETHQPLFFLVQTYYDWAHLYDPGEFNRTDYLNQSIEKATEYVWEVGTDSFVAYYIYYYDGLAHLELGKEQDGFDRLDFIVNPETGIASIFKSWEEQEIEMPEFAVREMKSLVEQTFAALGEFYNRQGQYDRTLEFATQLDAFYANWEKIGVEPGDWGDQFQLELGMARFRTGDGTGMTLLETVAKRHPGDAIGRMAGEYIAQVLSDPQGGGGNAQPIPPSVWLTAAETDARAGRTLDAIEKYHQALAGLDMISDAGEQLTTEISTWAAIGTAYRNLRRYVEASLAFNQSFRATRRITPEDKAATEKAATSWYNTLVGRYKETKDRRDRDAKDAAMRELQKIGIEDMDFLVARDDFEQARTLPDGSPEREEGFKDAFNQFRSVDKKTTNYERALVYLARCEGEQGKFEQALKRLSDYDKHIAKSDAGRTRSAQQQREISLTEATYYRALYLAELERHEEVIQALDGFEDKFTSQQAFFAGAKYQRLVSLIALGRLAEAEELFKASMAEAEGGGIVINPASEYYLAMGYRDAADKAEEAGDVDQARTYRKTFANYLYDYSEGRGFDSYPNLRLVADAHYTNEAWEDAEAIYLQLIKLFEKEPTRIDDINQVVKRRLADALVALEKYQEAADLYEDLLKLFPENPAVIRAAALCFGGWVDIVDGRPVEIPGSGAYGKAVGLWDLYFERAVRQDDKRNKNAKFWEAKFFTIYVRYRARPEDPTWFTQAQKLWNNLDTTVFPFYPDQQELTEKMGGDDWKRRFDYLRGRVQ